MTITNLLNNHGWRPAGSCHCDGYYTLKFRKALYEIKWRRKRYKFKVMEQNNTIHDWQALENLETVLNELDQKINAAQAARKTV